MPDDVSVGRQVRAVRLSKNRRQKDVAARAGVSQETVSRLERGFADGLTVRSLRAVSRALGMPPIVSLGWRGPEVERLRDRLHASIVETFASMLASLGWFVAAEASFSRNGERGSADILAWHAAAQTLLIVECKTRIWDLQDLLATLDRKRRLLPDEAEARWGWHPVAVGVVLVLPDMSTHRHLVERHAVTFRAVLPDRQRRVGDWLAYPAGSLRGIWFLPNSHQNGIGQRDYRIRASKRPSRGSAAGRST